MYRQIVHFLQGQVLVRIECGCPERWGIRLELWGD